MFNCDELAIVLERIFDGSLLFNFIIVFHPIESIFEAKILTNSFLRNTPLSEYKKVIADNIKMKNFVDNLEQQIQNQKNKIKELLDTSHHNQ